MPRAAGLAATLTDELGVEPVLVKGGGGVFTVVVDGKQIFSKQAAGRFPLPGEVVDRIKRA